MDLQELGDRADIEATLVRYTRAIDTGDWDFIDEPGDSRQEPEPAADPLSPPAGSGQVDAAAGETSTAEPIV